MQAVYPDKLLQFKPLDGLRLDLITVVGIAAVIAQIQVTSPLLKIVSLVSVTVAVVRSVLGYQRMFIRCVRAALGLHSGAMRAPVAVGLLHPAALSCDRPSDRRCSSLVFATERLSLRAPPPSMPNSASAPQKACESMVCAP